MDRVLDAQRRAADDRRVQDAGQRLKGGALAADSFLAWLRRNSRIAAIGAVAVIAAVFLLLVTTGGGGTVKVTSASQARETALDLRPGQILVRCDRGDDAWDCTGLRGSRLWSCRIFLEHAERQASTGSCVRMPRSDPQ